MATTISWQRLRDLASFRVAKGCAISLYLNLDPSTAPTAGDASTRINSLLAEVEKSDEATRADLGHDEREGLKADLKRIRDYLENDLARDGTRGVALFSAGLDNFWSALPLAEPVADRAKVGPDFYLAPLVPLVGRSDGAIVAFIGREKGQLFGLREGRLEEIVDRTEEQPGQHDQGGWSQARYERHIENLVQQHLRGVAEEVDREVRRHPSAMIVVVGAEDTRSEFVDLLSNEARNAVVGATNAEAHASPAQLLEVVAPVLEEARARAEAATIERWREEAGRNGRAASGWEATLEAASDGRVELLLYQEGVEREAWQCPACGRASVAAGNCPLDGTRLERREAGLDLAVHQTLAHGGTLCAIRPHHDLQPVEGVGALLRY